MFFCRSPPGLLYALWCYNNEFVFPLLCARSLVSDLFASEAIGFLQLSLHYVNRKQAARLSPWSSAARSTFQSLGPEPPRTLLPTFRVSARSNRAPCKPGVNEDHNTARGETPSPLLSGIIAVSAERLSSMESHLALRTAKDPRMPQGDPTACTPLPPSRCSSSASP